MAKKYSESDYYRPKTFAGSIAASVPSSYVGGVRLAPLATGGGSRAASRGVSSMLAEIAGHGAFFRGLNTVGATAMLYQMIQEWAETPSSTDIAIQQQQDIEEALAAMGPVTVDPEVYDRIEIATPELQAANRPVPVPVNTPTGKVNVSKRDLPHRIEVTARMAVPVKPQVYPGRPISNGFASIYSYPARPAVPTRTEYPARPKKPWTTTTPLNPATPTSTTTPINPARPTVYDSQVATPVAPPSKDRPKPPAIAPPGKVVPTPTPKPANDPVYNPGTRPHVVPRVDPVEVPAPIVVPMPVENPPRPPAPPFIPPEVPIEIIKEIPEYDGSVTVDIIPPGNEDPYAPPITQLNPKTGVITIDVTGSEDDDTYRPQLQVRTAVRDAVRPFETNTLRKDRKSRSGMAYLAAMQLINKSWGNISEVMDMWNVLMWNMYVSVPSLNKDGKRVKGAEIIFNSWRSPGEDVTMFLPAGHVQPLASLPLAARIAALRAMGTGDLDYRFDFEGFAHGVLIEQVQDAVIGGMMQLERLALNTIPGVRGNPVTEFGNVSTWIRRLNRWNEGMGTAPIENKFDIATQDVLNFLTSKHYEVYQRNRKLFYRKLKEAK